MKPATNNLVIIEGFLIVSWSTSCVLWFQMVRSLLGPDIPCMLQPRNSVGACVYWSGTTKRVQFTFNPLSLVCPTKSTEKCKRPHLLVDSLFLGYSKA